MSDKNISSFGYSLVLFLLLVLGLVICMPGVRAEEESDLKANPKMLTRWQEDRFGMFIHWGPVSLRGTEIGWSRGGKRRGWGPGGRGEVPAAEYDSLYKQFNPTLFNANQWVAIAKAAGMRYLVFTTKHHDGFCMFDSKLTDHKITNPECPFGRDVVAEIAKACHEGGIRLGFYYSPVDWYDRNYRTKNHDQYIQYLHGQLRELCTNYGQVDILWFDGLQVQEMPDDPPGGRNLPEYAKVWDSRTLLKMVRQLQPKVIVNNRCGLDADFATPEQHVGLFHTDRPWESCITLGEQWAWKPGDKIKSSAECIRMLVQCATGDGNLLLNVGPMPTGAIEPRQVERLNEIGAWTHKYGESIYATRGGPVRNGEWGGTTFKDDIVYVHVLKWPGDTISLPPLKQRVKESVVLTGGYAKVQQDPTGITIRVPREQRDSLDTIIKLELDSMGILTP
jgi:alpha-L-fucosidase